jgi:hypothetical protein
MQEVEKNMAATGIGATVFSGSAAPTKQHLSWASASHSSSSRILDKEAIHQKRTTGKEIMVGSNLRATYIPAEKLRHLEALEVYRGWEIW